MSDGFIPLNQSTPVQNKWQPGKQQNQRNYQNNRFQNGHRRSGYNRWGNNSRNSTFGSDSNNSYNTDNGPSIDAYLHPSMLEDPWAQLRQNTK